MSYVYQEAWTLNVQTLPPYQQPFQDHLLSTALLTQKISILVDPNNNYVSIYASYELSVITNVTRSTGIHTSHIIGIFLWTNMPATLHMYVQLQ